MSPYSLFEAQHVDAAEYGAMSAITLHSAAI
jgi:hypothetical protein